MAYAIVDEAQNMMDMAIQYLGDMTGVFDLANANGLSITSKITPGQKLVIPTAINPDAVKYFAAKGIVPSTELDESAIQGGIGYMKIGFDFRVS